MVNIANSINILNDGLLSLFNIDNENTKISDKKSNIKLNESLNEKLSEDEYGRKVQNGEIIEKYIDLTEPYIQYTIDKYLNNGWDIKHQGTTLMILYKDITNESFDDEQEKSMKFASDEEAYEWAKENGFKVLKTQDCQDGCLAFMKKQNESLNESPTDEEREVFKIWYDEYLEKLKNREDIMIAPYCGYSYVEENGTYYDIENDRFISPEEVEKILYHDYIDAVDEESINESLESLKQEFSNMTKLPVFDFADGPMYVDIKGNKMVAGTATNNGIIPEYEIELDETETLDNNLNRLYDMIIEEHPEYLKECLIESYEDKIEKELKNPTQNFTKKSGTITCYDEVIKDIVYRILTRYYYIVEVSDCQEDAKGECNFVISYDGLIKG